MPESLKPEDRSAELSDLLIALAQVQRRLEVADENENTIERERARDALLEQQDWLQAEIDVLTNTKQRRT